MSDDQYADLAAWLSRDEFSLLMQVLVLEEQKFNQLFLKQALGSNDEKQIMASRYRTEGAKQALTALKQELVKIKQK